MCISGIYVYFRYICVFPVYMCISGILAAPIYVYWRIYCIVPRFSGESVLLIFLVFYVVSVCFYCCFVCLRSLSCVPNIANVSGLSILVASSVFSNFYSQWLKKNVTNNILLSGK
jgi:hypothetical protein